MPINKYHHKYQHHRRPPCCNNPMVMRFPPHPPPTAMPILRPILPTTTTTIRMRIKLPRPWPLKRNCHPWAPMLPPPHAHPNQRLRLVSMLLLPLPLRQGQWSRTRVHRRIPHRHRGGRRMRDFATCVTRPLTWWIRMDPTVSMKRNCMLVCC